MFYYFHEEISAYFSFLGIHTVAHHVQFLTSQLPESMYIYDIYVLHTHTHTSVAASMTRHFYSVCQAEEESGEEGSGQEEQREETERPPDIALEEPPSYEAAVVKPPPYDLYHHLTPTQPRSALPAPPITEKKLHKSQFLGLPNLQQPPIVTDDEDDDVFLPSYQEAVRLSLKTEKKSEGEE